MDAMPGLPQAKLAFPADGGEMGALMRAHDWSASPLGHPDGWPQPLRTIAELMVNSKYPMFVAWGPELAFLYNDGYRPIFGAKHPAALGLPFNQVWSEIWDDISPLIERALAGEATFNENLHLVMERHGYPEDTWYTFSYSPVRDANGAIAGMFCSCTETTAQVKLDEQLRESEARFRLIADSAPVPIWVTKLDRKRGFVNRAYVDFVGVSYDEAIEFDWRTIIHPDDAGRILAESVAGEASLETFVLEARFRSSDGRWRWLQSISQPRWGAGGEHVGFIGVAHDITEWKEAEQILEGRVEARTADLRKAIDRLQAEVAEREWAEEALRQAQKMEAVGQLTGGIAHDFNNLLTPVIGGLELLARGVEEPRLQRIAEAALESGRRGAKLTGQLLAFSRLQRLKLAPVPVNRVIETMQLMLRHTLGGAITVQTDFSPKVDRAMCDENQLENAVLNLAINARDAMPDGGTLTITTSLATEPPGLDLDGGDYVAITVADSGQGMAPEVAGRAAEPFFTTKPLGKGTGLGLAQVYGIVRQAKGALRIESAEGEGTTVRLLLPRVSGEIVVEWLEDEANAATSGTRARPAKRIAVVDDDENVRAFLANALIGLGHQVESLDGAEAALAALAERAPDLVLIDFAMPGMNGAELARALRERHPALPIVFVTGFAESDQLEGALGSDVAVLKKPFGIEELAAVVASRVEGCGNVA